MHRSPSAARAGNHSMLSSVGRVRSSQFGLQHASARACRRTGSPAICNPMTKAAPITAATICATSRVRFGPMMRNSATVSATASAAAISAHAATTP